VIDMITSSSASICYERGVIAFTVRYSKFNRRRESHEVIKGAQVGVHTSSILLSHGLDPHRTLSRVSCIAVGILTASVLYVQDPSQARLFLLCDRSQSA